MNFTFLRFIKKQKFLKDGSSLYLYDNGCKNTYALLYKDLINHPVWARPSDVKKTEKLHPSLAKYKKRFAIKKKINS